MFLLIFKNRHIYLYIYIYISTLVVYLLYLLSSIIAVDNIINTYLIYLSHIKSSNISSLSLQKYVNNTYDKTTWHWTKKFLVPKFSQALRLRDRYATTATRRAYTSELRERYTTTGSGLWCTGQRLLAPVATRLHRCEQTTLGTIHKDTLCSIVGKNIIDHFNNHVRQISLLLLSWQ